MTWLYPNTTRTERSASADLERRPYVDTPRFSYVRWLEASRDGGNTRIGRFDAAPTEHVVVIGAGAAGLVAAYELLASGVDVTVLEQSNTAGGRMHSVHFSEGSPDIAELGAMRFPPAEECLFYYFNRFDIETTPDFPDPGKVPTLISFKGDVEPLNGTTPPKGFETVAKGWNALMQDGAELDGTWLTAPSQISSWLTSGTDADTDRAAKAWQGWIDAMANRSLYNGLINIFSSARPPGGQVWEAPLDYERFAALGSGFGGFGPLYQVGFLEILRLVINGLETDQVMVPGGIRQVASRFLQAPITRPDGSITYLQEHVHLGVTCGRIEKVEASGQWRISTNDSPVLADRILVTGTQRSLEIDTDTARFGNDALVPSETASAIRELHIMNSSKLFVRTETCFWKTSKSGTRAILNDTLSRAVYTLDYQDPNGTGVVLVSYTWGDDSIKQITMLDKRERLDVLRADIAAIDADFAANLVPAGGNYDKNVQMIDWEREPHFYGAFKLNRPGQSHYEQATYFDFQRAGTDADTGVFIAGSGISWTGGWIEGALQTGLNAAAAVVVSLGGSLTSESYNPLNRLHSTEYNYSPTSR